MARAGVAANPVAEIENLRARILELQTAIKATLARDILRPQAEAQAHVRELVRRGASNAQPLIESLLIENLARLRKPNFDILTTLNAQEPFSLVCALAPSDVEQRLLAMVDAAYGLESQVIMDAGEQAAQVEALRAELFVTECEEEAIIYRLERTGLSAPPRRRDADPRAIIDPSTLPEMEQL